jgi:hypothetical protein
MNERKLTELMNKVVDGVATPKDERRLREYLDADPVARREFDELMQLSKDLGQVEQFSPPTGFRDRVMATLPQVHARKRDWAASRNWREGIFTWLFANPLRPLAIGAGAGIAATAIFFIGTSRLTSPELSNIVGTIGSPDRGIVVTPVDVQLSAGLASATIRASGDTHAVRLGAHLDAAGGAALTIQFNNGEMRFGGVDTQEGRIESIAVEPSAVTLRCSELSNFAVRLNPLQETRSPLTLTLVAGEQSASRQLNLEVQSGAQ